MPTFVYMTRCDGCGHCVDICPSDIMHIDTTYRRAYNIEPNMCWECYSCVKACPQNAIDCRGYADFAPLGHSVRVLREEQKGSISWKIKFRDGREKNFVSPIRTTPWGSIKSPSDYEAPTADAMNSQELAHEPEALHIDALPTLTPDAPETIASGGSRTYMLHVGDDLRGTTRRRARLELRVSNVSGRPPQVTWNGTPLRLEPTPAGGKTRQKRSRRPVSIQRGVVTNVVQAGPESVTATLSQCSAPRRASSAFIRTEAVCHMLRQATNVITGLPATVMSNSTG